MDFKTWRNKNIVLLKKIKKMPNSANKSILDKTYIKSTRLAYYELSRFFTVGMLLDCTALDISLLQFSGKYGNSEVGIHINLGWAGAILCYVYYGKEVLAHYKVERGHIITRVTNFELLVK